MMSHLTAGVCAICHTGSAVEEGYGQRAVHGKVEATDIEALKQRHADPQVIGPFQRISVGRQAALLLPAWRQHHKVCIQAACMGKCHCPSSNSDIRA